MFTHWFTAPKRTAPRAQLQLEALESRWAPAHLVNPGVGEVVLPAAAAHGTVGIEKAEPAGNQASHSRDSRLILISH